MSATLHGGLSFSYLVFIEKGAFLSACAERDRWCSDLSM